MNIFKQFCMVSILVSISFYCQAEDAPEKNTGIVEKDSDKKAATAKSGSKKSNKKAGNKVKELSGISIIGNKEAPKSLYIVPWKNSEVGVRSSLTSGLLDESMRPVDKEVFMRELEFYELSHSK